MEEKNKMSIQEAERLGIMRQVDKKTLTLRVASKEMGLSLRQTKRVRKRYLKQGAKGLISLKRGKESNRKICKKLKNRTLRVIKANYSNFGPTLAAEKLKERDKITLSAETLRKWMIEEGLWKAKKKKDPKNHRM